MNAGEFDKEGCQLKAAVYHKTALPRAFDPVSNDTANREVSKKKKKCIRTHAKKQASKKNQ